MPGIVLAPTADSLPFDASGSSLVATTVGDALDELDGLGAYLKTQLIAGSLTVAAGKYAVWAEPYVAMGADLFVEAGGEFVDIS